MRRFKLAFSPCVPAVVGLFFAALGFTYVQAEETENGEDAPAEAVEEESNPFSFVAPSITIGGQTISSFNAHGKQDNTSLLLPESLKRPDFRKKLKEKVTIRTLPHTPSTGRTHAPINIIEFLDLGCGADCRDITDRLYKLQERHPKKVRFQHLYMPLDDKAVNMVNFYGKIAEKEKVFWDYRKSVLQNEINEAADALKALLDLNVAQTSIRLAARTQARTFYRELDQDALLATKLRLGKPPHLFVNGIHVGAGGIPLENLEDVILYELMQLKATGMNF